MAVDLKNHPGRNPDYEKGMRARRAAQEHNKTAKAVGLPLMPVPRQPNKYIPHIGKKEMARHVSRR